MKPPELTRIRGQSVLVDKRSASNCSFVDAKHPNVAGSIPDHAWFTLDVFAIDWPIKRWHAVDLKSPHDRGTRFVARADLGAGHNVVIEPRDRGISVNVPWHGHTVWVWVIARHGLHATWSARDRAIANRVVDLVHSRLH